MLFRSVTHYGARFIKPVIVPADTDVDLSVTAVISAVDADSITLDLTATSAGVKVLGIAKAVVSK